LPGGREAQAWAQGVQKTGAVIAPGWANQVLDVHLLAERSPVMCSGCWCGFVQRPF
jgi:hypothetical protein